MRNRIVTQGRYATVASTMALFLALGGTAYAINTVDTFDIVNDTITSVDIRNDAISTVDVHDEVLTGADVDDGSLRTADIADHTLEQADFGLGAAVPARWAVVDGATGISGPSNFMSATRTAVGTYRIVHQFPIGACVVVATPGERNGIAVDPGSTATVNITGTEVVVRTAVGGALQDVSFEVAFIC